MWYVGCDLCGCAWLLLLCLQVTCMQRGVGEPTISSDTACELLS